MNQNSILRRRRLMGFGCQELFLLSGLLSFVAACAPNGSLTIELGNLGARDAALCLNAASDDQLLDPQLVEPFRQRIKLVPPTGAAVGSKLTIRLLQLDESGQCALQGHGCLTAESEATVAEGGGTVTLEPLAQPRCPIDVFKRGSGRVCAQEPNQAACAAALNCPIECAAPTSSGRCFRHCRGYFAEPVTVRAYPGKDQLFSCWGTPACTGTDAETLTVTPGSTVTAQFDANPLCNQGWCPALLPQEVAANTINAIWGSDQNHVWGVGDKGTVIMWNGAVWRQDNQLQNDSPIPAVRLSGIWGSADPTAQEQWIVGGKTTVLQRDALTGKWNDKTQAAQGIIGATPNLNAVTGQRGLSGTHVAMGGDGILLTYQAEDAAAGKNPWYVFASPSSIFTTIASDAPDFLAAGFMGKVYRGSRTGWNIDNAASGMSSITWYSAWIHAGVSILAGSAGAISLKNAEGMWSPPGVAPPVKPTVFWNVWAASPKDIWFAGNNETVERFDGTSNWTVVPFPTLPQPVAIQAIWGSTNEGLDVWVATDGGGLWRYAGP